MRSQITAKRQRDRTVNDSSSSMTRREFVRGTPRRGMPMECIGRFALRISDNLKGHQQNKLLLYNNYYHINILFMSYN
jgi:hypothetical protein